MGKYFDIDIATENGVTAYRVVLEDDYGDLGCCYLVFENGQELGSICRLSDGQYCAIDHTRLTQAQIDHIGGHIGDQLMNRAS